MLRARVHNRKLKKRINNSQETSMTEENSSRDVSPYPDSRTASNLELHAVISTSNGPAISSNVAKYNVSGRPRLSSHHGGGKEHKFPWRVVEVLVLFAIVLSLLVISMIPTIFFVMPPLEFQPVSRYCKHCRGCMFTS